MRWHSFLTRTWGLVFTFPCDLELVPLVLITRVIRATPVRHRINLVRHGKEMNEWWIEAVGPCVKTKRGWMAWGLDLEITRRSKMTNCIY